MEFKDKSEIGDLYTTEIYYDLFEGGYIIPEDILANSDDIATVRNAIDIVKSFIDELIDKDILEVD